MEDPVILKRKIKISEIFLIRYQLSFSHKKLSFWVWSLGFLEGIQMSFQGSVLRDEPG